MKIKFQGSVFMSWKEKSVIMIREEFVKRVLSHEKSKAALCREYNISRPTGDKWIKRYINNEPLSNKSKAPFKTANKTSPDIENIILDYRKNHPAIGAVKIRRILENQGYQNLPCNSTVNAILKRNNCISKTASEAATPHKRFQKEKPNDMWQADFKGHFALGDNSRCYPLNVIDDHSRFNLCCQALTSEKFVDVVPVFVRLFKEYGLPKTLLCDNGNPWGTAQSTGYTNFEIWLMDLGILTIHGRPLHPQTQGKEESFNRSLKRELLKFHQFSCISESQYHFDKYREFYNNERPHHSLGLDVPSEHYCKSERKYPEKINEWEYPTEFKLKRVKSSGYITINSQGYFLSESFGDKTVAINESSHKGCFNIYYRQFKIARINIEKRVFESKRIYLNENDPRFNNLKV